MVFMQTHPLDHSTQLIVLKKGELVIETLTRHFKDKGIINASFTAIGAVTDVSCGYYDLVQKQYHFAPYKAVYEVVSATGDVMEKAGQPYIHLHAVFTDVENLAFGGHVEEMRVAATLEVVLTTYATALNRQYDDDTGLYLISP